MNSKHRPQGGSPTSGNQVKLEIEKDKKCVGKEDDMNKKQMAADLSCNKNFSSLLVSFTIPSSSSRDST